LHGANVSRKVEVAQGAGGANAFRQELQVGIVARERVLQSRESPRCSAKLQCTLVSRCVGAEMGASVTPIRGERQSRKNKPMAGSYLIIIEQFFPGTGWPGLHS